MGRALANYIDRRLFQSKCKMRLKFPVLPAPSSIWSTIIIAGAYWHSANTISKRAGRPYEERLKVYPKIARKFIFSRPEGSGGFFRKNVLVIAESRLYPGYRRHRPSSSRRIMGGYEVMFSQYYPKLLEQEPKPVTVLCDPRFYNLVRKKFQRHKFPAAPGHQQHSLGGKKIFSETGYYRAASLARRKLYQKQCRRSGGNRALAFCQSGFGKNTTGNLGNVSQRIAL